MATQFILQPNGLWAQYSTVTDQLEAIDCTEEEIIQEAVQHAMVRAEEDTKAYLKNRREGKLTQFSVEWDEAVAKTRKNCDDPEFLAEVEKVCQHVAP